MKVKILSFAILLTTNINLLSAVKNNTQENEIVVTIGFKAAPTQEESKISYEQVKQILEEAKKMAKSILKENCILFNEILIKTINDIDKGSVKSAWDLFIEKDNDGENISKLNILLKTDVVDINENCEIWDKRRPLIIAIHRNNYNLFEFLLKNDVILYKNDIKYLKEKIDWHVNNGSSDSLTQLQKMYSLIKNYK